MGQRMARRGRGSPDMPPAACVNDNGGQPVKHHRTELATALDAASPSRPLADLEPRGAAVTWLPRMRQPEARLRELGRELGPRCVGGWVRGLYLRVLTDGSAPRAKAM